MLDEVKKIFEYTNPDYVTIMKKLCLHYDMKLNTFGINNEMYLIIQFPVLVSHT